MAISENLKKSLENMDENGLKLIQSFYENNPKTKETCNEISDFIEKILLIKFSNGIKLDK